MFKIVITSFFLERFRPNFRTSFPINKSITHNQIFTFSEYLKKKLSEIWQTCPRESGPGGASAQSRNSKIWYNIPNECIGKVKKFQVPILTFALLGGVWTPPLRFFADSKKTAARSAAGFSPTLSPIFLPTFVKVSILGHARSGHQVRSSDHTLQKLYNRAPATVFEGKLWNFRNMIRSSVATKCISRIFDISDLRSGHFRDLPIISQWAKIKLPVLCFILSLYGWNRFR